MNPIESIFSNPSRQSAFVGGSVFEVALRSPVWGRPDMMKMLLDSGRLQLRNAAAFYIKDRLSDIYILMF